MDAELSTTKVIYDQGLPAAFLASDVTDVERQVNPMSAPSLDSTMATHAEVNPMATSSEVNPMAVPGEGNPMIALSESNPMLRPDGVHQMAATYVEADSTGQTSGVTGQTSGVTGQTSGVTASTGQTSGVTGSRAAAQRPHKRMPRMAGYRKWVQELRERVSMPMNAFKHIEHPYVCCTLHYFLLRCIKALYGATMQTDSLELLLKRIGIWKEGMDKKSLRVRKLFTGF